MSDLQGGRDDATGLRRPLGGPTGRPALRRIDPRPAGVIPPSDAAARDDEHVLDLIPGYALGALDEDETALVERHAPFCRRCSRDLDATLRTAGMLPFSVAPATPPPDVKATLFTRIAHSRSHAASAPDVPSWAAGAKDAPPGRTPTLPASDASEVPVVPRAGSSPAVPRARRRSRVSSLFAFSTPLVVVLGLLGMWGVYLRDTDRGTADGQPQIEDVLNRTDDGDQPATAMTAAMSPAIESPSTPRFSMQRVNDRLVVQVQDLHDASPVEAYDVWFVTADGGIDHVGEVQVEANGRGRAPVKLPRDQAEYRRICLTEPSESAQAKDICSAAS